MAMTYREQLLHPNWQRRRLEILQRDEFRCRLCCDAESTLHVHHKQYVKGRMAWEYPDVELVSLCESCHGVMHEINAVFRTIGAALPVDGPGSISDAVSLLAGWAHGQQQGLSSIQYRDTGSPIAFAAGSIAQGLERGGLNINSLSALADALWGCPSHVVEAAADNFIKQLIERRNDPMPDQPARGFSE